MAFLSSLRDHDIADTFHLSGDAFESALLGFTAVLDGTSRFHYFVVQGNEHTALGAPATTTDVSGKALSTWLTELTSDDMEWTSTKPR
jgi:hypothetical protein